MGFRRKNKSDNTKNILRKVNKTDMLDNNVLSVEFIRNIKLFSLSLVGTLFPFLLFTIRAFFEGIALKQVFTYWFGRTDIFLAMICILLSSISTNLFTKRFRLHGITVVCISLTIALACYTPALVENNIRPYRVFATFIITLCISFVNLIYQIYKGVIGSVNQ